MLSCYTVLLFTGDFQDSTSFYHNANEDVDDNGLE